VRNTTLLQETPFIHLFLAKVLTIEIILLQLFGVANVILSFINLKNNCFILW